MPLIDLWRGAAAPRPFSALRCCQAAGLLTVRRFLGFGVPVVALTLLATTAPAASESDGDKEAEAAPQTQRVLARAVRDAYWQAVSVCLALAEPADRGQCGAAARAVRQHDMAVCQKLFGDSPTPDP